MAVRFLVDHVDGADVVCVRPRRRDARLVADQAREPDLSDARLVDPHHQRPCRRALSLRGGVLRDHLDQHHHALSGLRLPDLPQLA